ncbi:MAG TPA: hypothetical protein VNR65_12120, partial [Geobacterales bacterium]|nr:hypothetical protein [Geobacterales bacterium]
MSLRVSDDDRPGYAILDFGRDTGTDDLLISLQSKLFNTGEYLGPGGKWSKAPHFFKAVRLTSAGPGIYRIGPEIVNQQDLAHDTIEVSVGSGGVVEEATWPELTPAPFEPGTAIYREPVPPPPQEPIRPASKPAAESPPRVVEERPAKEDAGTPVTKTPAWLKFGVPAAALFFLVMLSSWLFCTPFGFLCPTPVALDLAIKVAFQNAKSCAESNRADPCAARQCFEEFLKDPQAPRENRADAERLAANLKLTCEAKKRDDADKDAAAKAETCIGENGRPPCRNSENCLAAYVASSPSGGERERLSRLARETFEKCKGEAVR